MALLNQTTMLRKMAADGSMATMARGLIEAAETIDQLRIQLNQSRMHCRDACSLLESFLEASEVASRPGSTIYIPIDPAWLDQVSISIRQSAADAPSSYVPES